MKEGDVEFKASAGKVCKQMGVFYNPVMAFNRSISVVLLNALPMKKFIVALPLSATGIRGIRLLKEVNKQLEVHFNDLSKEAVKLIKQNLKKNKLEGEVSNLEANEFLLKSHGFSYIDVDPFGSPNAFLDAAVRRLARKGILAVTATDTAPLAGTYPKACLRKYWAKPMRNEHMHENGLRILIRKVQLIGAQYDKALNPVFSYYKHHYYRIFFHCEKSKQGCDKLIKQHGMLGEAGPLWLGPLWDKAIVRAMIKHSTAQTKAFLERILEEAKVNALGFYSLGGLGKRHKLKALLPKQAIIEKLRKAGFKAASTHFSPEAIVVNGIPKWEKILR